MRQVAFVEESDSRRWSFRHQGLIPSCHWCPRVHYIDYDLSLKKLVLDFFQLETSHMWRFPGLLSARNLEMGPPPTHYPREIHSKSDCKVISITKGFNLKSTFVHFFALWTACIGFPLVLLNVLNFFGIFDLLLGIRVLIVWILLFRWLSR